MLLHSDSYQCVKIYYTCMCKYVCRKKCSSLGDDVSHALSLGRQLYRVTGCLQHLQGDYVMRPQPPAEVPAVDYDVIYKMTHDLNVENRELLDVFYKRDENALPQKYIFQVRAPVRTIVTKTVNGISRRTRV